MDIKVYLMQENGTITEVVLTDVSNVRYEKANKHNGKPDIVAIQNKTDSTDWVEYDVVAEFHLEDVVGWAEVKHLPTAQAGD